MSLHEGFGLSLLLRDGKRHWRLNGDDITDKQALTFVRGLESAIIKALLDEMPLLPGWARP